MKRSKALRLLGTAAAVSTAILVAGCSSDEGVSPADTLTGKLIRGSTEPAYVPDPETIKPIAYCPKVQIRPGTQTHLVTHRAKRGAAPEIRYQGTIKKTARECDTLTGNLVMKVGVSGRLLAGPKGGSGTVSLPIRIVAVVQPLEGEGEAEVLYSKLHQIAVDLPEGRGSVAWAHIDDGINIKLDKRTKVYVGFDSDQNAKKKK